MARELISVSESSEDSFRDLSGGWAGYWTQQTDRVFHRTECELQFTRGVLTGGGDDEVGPFILHGGYAPATQKCWWRKSYAGHDILYSGVHAGETISGKWEDPMDRAWCGDFRLWPRGHASMEAEFFLTADQPLVQRPLPVL